MTAWCEANLVIPIETQTPWPGPYSTAQTPWVRGWYEIIEDPDTRLFAIKKGAQTACTQTFMGASFYWTCEDPGAVLYVMDSTDVVRETSKLRLIPTINATPALAAELKQEEQDSTTNLLYRFRRCFWRLVGSNSLGKISSFTQKYAIIEEPEKYRQELGKEGSPIEAILQRLKRIEDSKALIGCTPSTKNGFIFKYVRLGDLCLYFVPCPHCAGEVVLRFSDEFGKDTFEDGTPFAYVNYDKELSPQEAARGAHLICPLCGGEITDDHKRSMVDDGIWRPTKEAEIEGYRSAWLGGLYPKDSSASIRAFVQSYLAKKGNRNDLQVWVNQDCGETFEEPPVKAVAMTKLWKIRKANAYPRFTFPSKNPALLFATIDVQDSHLVYCVWAADAGNLWLVDHGMLSTMDDIRLLFEETYKNGNGDAAPLRIALMDTGHRTIECYRYCLAHPGKIIPVKGERGVKTSGSRAPIALSDIEKFPTGHKFTRGRKLKLHHIHPKHFKDELARAIERTMPEDEEEVEDGRLIWFHEDIDRDYVWQMSGEVLREGKEAKDGETDQYWAKIHTNDFFDCAQYAFAYLEIPAVWRRLAQMARGIEQEEGKDTKTEPKKAEPKPAAPDEDLPPCRACGGDVRIEGDCYICNKCRTASKRNPRPYADKFDD